MIKHIEKANEFMRSKKMAAIEWCLSILVVLIGIYMIMTTGFDRDSVLTLGFGILGLVLAKLKPAVKLQDYLFKRLVNKLRT